MRKLVIATILMVLCGLAYAGDKVTVDNGRSAEAYQVFVATAAYQVIDANYAGAYSCYSIKVLAGSIWYDYDSSVSTSRSGLTYKVNGKTGESNRIMANETKIINGTLDNGVWLLCDSLSPGATVQIDINRLYP